MVGNIAIIFSFKLSMVPLQRKGECSNTETSFNSVFHSFWCRPEPPLEHQAEILFDMRRHMQYTFVSVTLRLSCQWIWLAVNRKGDFSMHANYSLEDLAFEDFTYKTKTCYRHIYMNGFSNSCSKERLSTTTKQWCVKRYKMLTNHFRFLQSIHSQK